MAKSVHQPFETWLFSDEPLTAEQAQALNQHLRQCARCQQREAAWKEVRQALSTSPQVEPRPGFTARWQAKMAAQQLERQRRQVWTILILTAGIIIELLLLLGAQIMNLLRQPGQILIIWVYFISRLLGIIQTIQLAGEKMASINLPLLAVIGSVSALAWLSFWGTLWIVAYKQLSARRIRL